MTVVTIVKQSFGLRIKGDTSTYTNVKAIRQSKKNEKVVEIVKGKNWIILVNTDLYQIQII